MFLIVPSENTLFRLARKSLPGRYIVQQIYTPIGAADERVVTQTTHAITILQSRKFVSQWFCKILTQSGVGFVNNLQFYSGSAVILAISMREPLPI
jgi:hypothetical protein